MQHVLHADSAIFAGIPAREHTLKDVFRFLGVADDFWTPAFMERLNTSAQKEKPAKWFEWVTPRWLRQEMLHAKILPWKINQGLQKLSRLGATALEKPRLDSEQDRAIQALLADDIARLRQWLNDPLPEWRPYSQAS